MPLVLLMNSRLIVEIWSSKGSSKATSTQKFLDMISHWIYIDLRNNKNDLQKGRFLSGTDNFFITVNKNCPKVAYNFSNLNENNSCFHEYKQKLSAKHFLCPRLCCRVTVFLPWGPLQNNNFGFHFEIVQKDDFSFSIDLKS